MRRKQKIMKVLKKSLLNVLLALVMVFSFVFPGWGNFIANIKANAETAVVNLT
jgi:hypothetical protein